MKANFPATQPVPFKADPATFLKTLALFPARSLGRAFRNVWRLTVRDSVLCCRFGDITILNGKPFCFERESTEPSCQKNRVAPYFAKNR